MSNAALILIDIQTGFDDLAYWGGKRNNPDAEKQAARLLAHWRKNGWPRFHVRHDSTTPGSRLAPGQPGNKLKDVVAPLKDEVVISKNVNSAFIGTDLKERLDRANIRTVVIAGLTTDHCVSTTARMAANLGFETLVVSDATATFDRTDHTGKKFEADTIHDITLASLHGEFASVVSSEEVIKKISNG